MKNGSRADNKKSFRSLLTNFSKAFDCLSQDLLIAKLNEYEVSISDLRFVHSYLKSRMQRTKINSQYSSWSNRVWVSTGVYTWASVV